MNLLLDQGLPRSAAALLNDHGHDAVHVGNVGMSSAEDAAILEFARLTSRVIVTLDADFHSLLARSGAIVPSVIRLRLEGLKADAVCQLVRTVVEQLESVINDGAAVTVTEDRIRYRKLPLPTNHQAP